VPRSPEYKNILTGISRENYQVKSKVLFYLMLFNLMLFYLMLFYLMLFHSARNSKCAFDDLSLDGLINYIYKRDFNEEHQIINRYFHPDELLCLKKLSQ
jgi:hypothetical protein